MKRPTLLFGAFLTASVVLTCAGCFHAREVANARRAITETLPQVRLDREMEFSLGPGVLHIANAAGFVAGAAVDDSSSAAALRTARRYLGDIRRVGIGVYEVDGDFTVDQVEDIRLPQLATGRWETLVRVREDEGFVWIIYEDDQPFIRPLYPESAIRNVLLVVLDDEELVIARVYGNLERIMRRAVREHMPEGGFDIFGNDEEEESVLAKGLEGGTTLSTPR